jgi:hypothetical protein
MHPMQGLQGESRWRGAGLGWLLLVVHRLVALAAPGGPREEQIFCTCIGFCQKLGVRDAARVLDLNWFLKMMSHRACDFTRRLT